MTTATLNGRSLPRRSLNDSIEKLDAILDGLGEAIPATIRESLQQSLGDAVAAGVKAALVEVMTNAEVLGRLPAPPAAAAAPAEPSFLGRIAAKVRAAVAAAWNWAAPRAATLRTTAAETAVGVRRSGANLVHRLRWLAACRRAVGIALLVGLALAGVAYCSSPACASLLTGAAATVSALGVQFALWTRRTLNRLLMA